MSCKWNFHDLRMCIWWQAYHIYFLYRMTPKAGMLRWWSIQKERGASSCHSFHNVKAFALPSQSKRATRISPTKGLYITMLADNWVLLWLYIINEAYTCIHLTAPFPVALSLTDSLKLRSSYIVKTKASENAFCMSGLFSSPGLCFVLSCLWLRHNNTEHVTGSLDWCLERACLT